MVILDTDHMSILERGDSAQGELLRDRLNVLPLEERATTIISYEEQIRGWMAYLAKAKKQPQIIDAYRRLKEQLLNYCRIIVLDYDEAAATHFQHLKKMKLRGGTKDCQIASIALAHHATVLTRNLSHFNDIPDLQVEDWTV